MKYYLLPLSLLVLLLFLRAHQSKSALKEVTTSDWQTSFRLTSTSRSRVSAELPLLDCRQVDCGALQYGYFGELFHLYDPVSGLPAPLFDGIASDRDYLNYYDSYQLISFADQNYYSGQRFFPEITDLFTDQEQLSFTNLLNINGGEIYSTLAGISGAESSCWLDGFCRAGLGGKFNHVRFTDQINSHDYFFQGSTNVTYRNSNLALPGHPIVLSDTPHYLMPGGQDFFTTSPLLIDFSAFPLLDQYDHTALVSQEYRAVIGYYSSYYQDEFGFHGLGKKAVRQISSGTILAESGLYEIVLFSPVSGDRIIYRGAIETAPRPGIDFIVEQAETYSGAITSFFTPELDLGKTANLVATSADLTLSFSAFDQVEVGFAGETKEVANSARLSAEGRYQVHARGATDISYSFLIDKTAPVGHLQLSSGTPVNNGQTITSQHSVNFTYPPAGNDEAAVRLILQVDGARAQVIPSTYNSLNFINPGRYNLYLVDAAGNYNYYSFTILDRYFMSEVAAVLGEPVTFQLNGGTLPVYASSSQPVHVSLSSQDDLDPAQLIISRDLKPVPFTLSGNTWSATFSEPGDYNLSYQLPSGYHQFVSFRITEEETAVYYDEEEMLLADQVGNVKKYFTGNFSDGAFALDSPQQILLKDQRLLGLTHPTLPYHQKGVYQLGDHQVAHHLFSDEVNVLITPKDHPALLLPTSIENGKYQAKTVAVLIDQAEVAVFINFKKVAQDNQGVLTFSQDGHYEISVNARIAYTFTINNNGPRFISPLSELTYHVGDQINLPSIIGTDSDLNPLTAAVVIQDEAGVVDKVSSYRPAIFTLDYTLTDRYGNIARERTYLYVISLYLSDNFGNEVADMGYASEVKLATPLDTIYSLDHQRSLADATILVNGLSVPLKNLDKAFNQALTYHLIIGNTTRSFTLLFTGPSINLMIDGQVTALSATNNNSLSFLISATAQGQDVLAGATLSRDGVVIAPDLSSVNAYRFSDDEWGTYQLVAWDKAGNYEQKEFIFIGKNQAPTLDSNPLPSLNYLNNQFTPLPGEEVINSYVDQIGNNYLGAPVKRELFYHDNANNDYVPLHSGTLVDRFGQVSGLYIVRYTVYDVAGNPSSLEQLVYYAEISMENVYAGGRRSLLAGSYYVSGQIEITIPLSATGIRLNYFSSLGLSYLGAGQILSTPDLGVIRIGGDDAEFMVTRIAQPVALYLSDGNQETLINDNYINSLTLAFAPIQLHGFTIIYDYSSLSRFNNQGNLDLLVQGEQLQDFFRPDNPLPSGDYRYEIALAVECGPLLTVSFRFHQMVSAPTVVTHFPVTDFYLVPENSQAIIPITTLIASARDAFGNAVEDIKILVNGVVGGGSIINSRSLVTYLVTDRAGNFSSININYYFSEEYRPYLYYHSLLEPTAAASGADYFIASVATIETRIQAIWTSTNAVPETVAVEYRLKETDSFVLIEQLSRHNYPGSTSDQLTSLTKDLASISFAKGYYRLTISDSFGNTGVEMFQIVERIGNESFTPLQTLIIGGVAFLVIDVLVFTALLIRKKRKNH